MNPRKLQKKTKIKAAMKYLVVLAVVLLVAIFQDQLLSSPNLPFPESESFLFNSYFILILPIAWVMYVGFSKVAVLRQIQSLFLKRILFALMATILQVLLFAVIVQIVYRQKIDFGGTLRFIFAEDLYKYLLVYSVTGLILIRRKNKPKLTSMP